MLPLVSIQAWVLTGMALGFFSTLYGAMRSEWHIWRICAHILDWLWFVFAAIFILGVYFWTGWGAFRMWSMPIMALGYGLWVWMAAPLAFRAVSKLLSMEARVVFYITYPLRGFTLGIRGIYNKFRDGITRRLHTTKKPPSPPPNSPQM
ncbi:MAG: hypothetical protein C7B43_04305 [Sulfobacillus benefaciens]|jgi:hypothetical protein|uniref:Spore cortex biosynthesis protein YabQ n=1 Tax=Sulfobacillus benefaciens TaxID=453960 RepID=A0A2T2X8Q9_9FIRM|nr:MAG: hypothetical protein C7B43_04305 [Sulfobacillus benefaciens]